MIADNHNSAKGKILDLDHGMKWTVKLVAETGQGKALEREIATIERGIRSARLQSG